jgi:hypothetical protein
MDSPTGGELTWKWARIQIATRDRQLKSGSGKRLLLSLGRKNDRNKEQHCGEQHNGGTGGNIPVGGDKDSSH